MDNRMRDSIPGEEWRPAFGYEGRYEVSNLGRLWSIPRPHPAVKTGCIVKPSIDRLGYASVVIDRKTVRISRLVLFSFVGPDPERPHAAHNNGDPRDNRLANLRWATRKENMADKKKHGTYGIGESHNRSLLDSGQVAELRQLRREGWTWERLASRYGVSTMTACSAGIGRTYSDLDAIHPPADRGRRYKPEGSAHAPA